MPLSLKTMEVQIFGEQWNKRFRTVRVNHNSTDPSREIEKSATYREFKANNQMAKNKFLLLSFYF